MNSKRILTVQDISCVGECSLTVALPVISVCGAETCVIPSAVLSTHTGGFKNYTFRNLSADIPKIANHWKKEEIFFDAIYTGYLGSPKQTDYVIDIMNTLGNPKCIKIIDPVMADNGKLYNGFDENYVLSIKKLCSMADFLLPNISEACLLTKTEYRTDYDSRYISELVRKLAAIGSKNIILTGVSYNPDKTGVVIYNGNSTSYYEHDRLPGCSHGTGDVYSSAFTGALMNDICPEAAAEIAADFVLECIKETRKYENHWYGTRFEPVLYRLPLMINDKKKK